ncbi:hypothetical protein SELMODRAFT_402244 [Selaginella moellendorffii]|uniref:Uncharacterized protein n=1 Tax=Selaginella moellendorffii TaxID=88036 RepID=D8QQ17_SELML|nr:hypothetical protein SELMODRAFT_402244 [Selaginella moellendorffii]
MVVCASLAIEAKTFTIDTKVVRVFEAPTTFLDTLDLLTSLSSNEEARHGIQILGAKMSTLALSKKPMHTEGMSMVHKVTIKNKKTIFNLCLPGLSSLASASCEDHQRRMSLEALQHQKLCPVDCANLLWILATMTSVPSLSLRQLKASLRVMDKYAFPDDEKQLFLWSDDTSKTRYTQEEATQAYDITAASTCLNEINSMVATLPG